jgi:hypothetical protein
MDLSLSLCPMDEGTLKTPIPKCRLYWSFLFLGGKLLAGSESGQKKNVKLLQNMVYNTTQHPTATHGLYKHTVHLLWKWRGREVREKVEGQQYTSRVPSSIGATVHKLGQKYQPRVNVSLVFKIC